MRRILILDTGTQGLAIINSLHTIKCFIGLVYREYNNYADRSKFIGKKYYVESPIMDKSYLQTLIAIIKSDNYDALIPMSDQAAEFLSKNKNELKKYVAFKVADYANFLNGYDKNKLMSLCAIKGYPHPKTIDLNGFEIGDLTYEMFKRFPFPAMLKPNLTTGGRGMRYIENYEDLTKVYPTVKKQYGDCHLQQFIQRGGHQLKIQIYVDSQQRLVCSSVMDKIRWYPITGGASCCSVSTKSENMVNICHNVLKDIKWEGFADFDIIENPITKELLIMEINPRVPACIRTAISAGINWGEVIINDIFNIEQKKYNYITGMSVRHLGFDCLWFLRSSERFNTIPSWFNFFGKNVHYQDLIWNDPKPFFMGTFHNILKLFNVDFRREKQGV